MPHRVLIVGLGRIAMGYDLDKDEQSHVLTHARAFAQHPAFQLVGGADFDASRRQLFHARFGCAAFETAGAAMRELQPDVVVIATPTAAHTDSVRDVLANGTPRILFTEKPLAPNLQEAQTIVSACRMRGCALYVNYMRHADVTVAEISRRLAAGDIRTPVNGVVWYSKGLFNSASHFVNLMQLLLGEAREVRVLRQAEPAGDTEIEPDFSICFERGEIRFLAARAYPWFHNAFEWIASNGRLRYERGGALVTWETTAADVLFSGYTTLGSVAETLVSDFQRIQWHVADQLAIAMTGMPARICSGAAALATIQILTRIELQP